MSAALRHARERLTSALSRCSYPSPDAQFLVEDAFAKLKAAETTGKSYAAALAAVAQALVELEVR
jgi:hypothetical protein